MRRPELTFEVVDRAYYCCATECVDVEEQEMDGHGVILHDGVYRGLAYCNRAGHKDEVIDLARETIITAPSTTTRRYAGSFLRAYPVN